MSDAVENVVEVRDLVKTFSTGFIRTSPRMPGVAPSWIERAVAKIPGGDKIHKMVEEFEPSVVVVFVIIGAVGWATAYFATVERKIDGLQAAFYQEAQAGIRFSALDHHLSAFDLALGHHAR